MRREREDSNGKERERVDEKENWSYLVERKG